MLEADIDPSGFGTSYRFEWGATPALGHQVPENFEPYIGSGNTPVHVTAGLTGLSPTSTYYYRVVASNVADGRSTTESPIQTLETLNSCGLPEGRCYEMVSPRNPFAANQPGDFVGASAEIHFQAAEMPGGLAYLSEVGEEDATKGAELLVPGDARLSWLDLTCR